MRFNDERLLKAVINKATTPRIKKEVPMMGGN
jgi:hypothetical protein